MDPELLNRVVLTKHQRQVLLEVLHDEIENALDRIIGGWTTVEECQKEAKRIAAVRVIEHRLRESLS
jgi:hypothetical protein